MTDLADTLSEKPKPPDERVIEAFLRIFDAGCLDVDRVSEMCMKDCERAASMIILEYPQYPWLERRIEKFLASKRRALAKWRREYRICQKHARSKLRAELRGGGGAIRDNCAKPGRRA